MKIKNKTVSKKSKQPFISIVLHVATCVVGVVGIALLVNNIILFRSAMNQYVAQGYNATTVAKQLIPAQLLPGIFEPVAVYGGIAFILLGASIIYDKISKCLTLLSKDEVCKDAIEEGNPEQNAADIENTEISGEVEVM